MSGGIEIRPATKADLVALTELRARAARANPEDAAFLNAHPEALELPPDILPDTIVACHRDGTPVGLASTRDHPDSRREITGLFVDPDHWREGIGRKLLDAVIEGAGHRPLIATANRAALGFYEACGFHRYGTARTTGGDAPPAYPVPDSGDHDMTELPASTDRKMGLVIDLDTCVGCHACVVACKGWNTENYGAPLSDQDAYGAAPSGTFLNRVHSYEVLPEAGPAQLVHFPKSCLHCEDAPCVTVCPTGASYKRADDGIVLVNEDACIGCSLCAWACPYGARELDRDAGIMKKCTLCVDRIYNDHLPEEDRVPACVRTCPAGARHFGDLGDPDSDVSRLVADRGGIDLMPEQGTKPVNKYLPSRPKTDVIAEEDIDILAPLLAPVAEEPTGFLGWLDRALEKL